MHSVGYLVSPTPASRYIATRNPPLMCGQTALPPKTEHLEVEGGGRFDPVIVSGVRRRTRMIVLPLLSVGPIGPIEQGPSSVTVHDGGCGAQPDPGPRGLHPPFTM